ncbi:hypothetical protein KM043_002522 [Ampulex compressa]|nr:hypothetical protein KM043_002522 [Ampulex compressa]
MFAPLMGFTLSQFVPNFLDIVIPLNESRPHQIPALTEYFVDPEEYFYFIFIHINLVVYVGTLAIIANETVIIIALHHICALFKIVSYRLNNTYHHDAASQYSDHSRQCVTDESVISVIKAHKNALEFANAFLHNFPTAYFTLLSLAVVSITLCLYRLQQALLLMDDIPELMNAVCHLTANLVYLFFANFLGQSVMDHSSSIFVDIYCAPWYTASLPAQHTLLFVMHRSAESCAISVGGIFVPCFEGFAMLTTCVTTKCTGDVLLKLLPYVVLSMVFFVKYASICFKTEVIIFIFEQMERNWHTLKDEDELEILKKYSEYSRLFSISFATAMLTPLICFTISQFVPNFLDIIMPLNESRPLLLPTSTEFFIDPEKYFYYILIHINVVVYIGTLAIIANETIIIIALHHICALFKIVSYRLNSTYRHDTASQYSDHSRQCVTDESVIGVIKAHKNALEFANAFLQNFPTAYFSLLSLGIVLITLCLYRLQQALLLMDDIPELVNAVCHLIAYVIYLFFANFLGQSMMNHSSSIFVDIYRIKTSLDTERLKTVISPDVLAYNDLAEAAKSHKGIIELVSRIKSLKELKIQAPVALFTLGQVGYIFFCNYMGQSIMDHSIMIFDRAYESDWYAAPVPAQKVLLFILQRSLKKQIIVVCGLFMPSLEGFVTLINTAVSYYMVIRSAR